MRGRFILDALHDIKIGEKPSDVLGACAEEIWNIAKAGDVNFFVSLGQLLEQMGSFND